MFTDDSQEHTASNFRLKNKPNERKWYGYSENDGRLTCPEINNQRMENRRESETL
jgi:hypothetical protein